MEHTMIAAEIHDDNTRISYYSNQLLTLVQTQFRTRKIDKYDYERFINILTCLTLQTDESKRKIDDYIRKEQSKYVSIDYKV